MPHPVSAAPAPLVTLTANLEQPMSQEGKPVVLDLALHNSSPEQFRYFSAFEESSFQMTVTGKGGRPIPHTALGERVLTPPMSVSMNILESLDPRKTLLYRFNLARLFDLSRTGTYTINVSRVLNNQTTLTAAPLRVTLVEAAAAYSGKIAPERLLDHGTFFYVANENYSHWTSWAADGKYLTNESVVQCFRVGPDGNVFSTLNAPVPVNKGTGSIAATPDGHFIYVGNENTISQFRVGNNGVLSPLSPPMVPAQRFPRPLLMDPKGRFLYTVDGAGHTLYAVGQDGRLTMTDQGNIPSGFSILNAAGTLLYSCSEGTTGYRLDASGRVTARLRTEHALERKMADGLTLGEQDAAVALTPSGRFAFVLASRWIGPPENPTARAEDVVMPMRVDENDNLVPVPGIMTPRDKNGDNYGCTSLTVDPTGHILLVLNSQLDFIAPYRIEANGSLTALTPMQIKGRPALLFLLPGSPLVYVNDLNNGSLLAFRVDTQSGLTPAEVSPAEAGIPDATNLAVVTAPTPPKAGMTRNGLQMSLWMTGDVQPAGKPLAITVVIKNVTAHVIDLGKASADMFSFHLAVSGPQRQSLGELRVGGEPIAGAVPLLAAGHDLFDKPGKGGTEVVLPPGQQRQYRFLLSRLADLTVAGNYTVQITRTLPGGMRAASPVVPFLLDGPYNGVTRGDLFQGVSVL